MEELEHLPELEAQKIAEENCLPVPNYRQYAVDFIRTLFTSPDVYLRGVGPDLSHPDLQRCELEVSLNHNPPDRFLFTFEVRFSGSVKMEARLQPSQYKGGEYNLMRVLLPHIDLLTTSNGGEWLPAAILGLGVEYKLCDLNPNSDVQVIAHKPVPEWYAKNYYFVYKEVARQERDRKYAREHPDF